MALHEKHAKYLIKYVTGLDRIVNDVVFRCMNLHKLEKKYRNGNTLLIINIQSLTLFKVVFVKVLFRFCFCYNQYKFYSNFQNVTQWCAMQTYFKLYVQLYNTIKFKRAYLHTWSCNPASMQAVCRNESSSGMYFRSCIIRVTVVLGFLVEGLTTGVQKALL